MPSELSIANRALVKLGEMPLSALDGPSKAARLVAAGLGPLRDAELAAFAWPFAKARARLTALAEKPPCAWQFQYGLPADCLRVLEVGAAYSLEGGRLLSNSGPTLRLLYIRQVADAALYPPLFAEALASRLAAELAESLTGSTEKRQAAWSEYRLMAGVARRAAGLETPPEETADNSWLLARREA